MSQGFKFTTPVYVDPGSRPSAQTVGQGPAQGDRNWHERHAADEVQASPLAGVDQFSPQNFAGNPVMQIATGTAGPQNPSPPLTAHSNQPGPQGEPGPVSGVQYPIPTPAEVSTSPGAQRSHTSMRKDVHDAYPMNPAETFAPPATMPNSPSVLQAIANGAAGVSGGSGAHAGETTDESLPIVDSVFVPPSWPLAEHPILPISESAGPGPRAGLNTSPSP